MSPNPLREAPKAAPCAGCGAASDAGEVWGCRVCYVCFAHWIADDRFDTATINAALGISNRVEDFTKANHERYCAESTRRTKAWLGERKTARAA